MTNANKRRRGHRWMGLLAFPVMMIAALGLGACGSDDDTTQPGSESGSVRIALSDAPFPFSLVDTAMVRIDSVSVHLDAAADAGGWITIDDHTRVVNLLDLQNGVTEEIAAAEVPVGEIDQLRLHVSDAGVTLVDGRSFDLEIPSGDRTGIKVFPTPNILVVSDLTTDLLLDFDVSNSFHPIPASPNHVDDIREFQFRPTLHVANLTSTGTVSGMVFTTLGTETEIDDLPLAGAAITLYDGPTEVAGTATTTTGAFRVMGIPAGEYRLVVTMLGFVESVATVDVIAGNETVVAEQRLDPIGG
ncbi:MAG: DUF4382 domain-containing protein [Candidatus Eisenbacteria bacterium]|uniref:DUF4382 domain-containing protein n=1 Tax=Eiseniibacteriota bacterium TaxID=2212470 RepID=A0A956RMX0_UNCEI|nr:DUF4382 domain-containing protein [Candidatus Eisenbacteria bacterium]